MRIDPFTLKVLENHSQAIADSMAWTLMRTAHSAFVKETEDFSCGLLTPDGMTFASPRGFAATWFIGLDYARTILMIDQYEEGDICITNDPYSGYTATHTPDIHIWKPIFWEGEIIAFAAGHIHNTDMGGAVPASLSRVNSEIHQEGVRFRPCKLFSRGVLNQPIIDTMLLNVRMPDQNWGDLNAQIASVNIGEQKIHELIRRFGVDTVRNGIQDLLDVAEKRARQVIATLPDGEYHAVDYIDEDSAGGIPVRLEVKLTIKGDEVVLDFTGSDPQLQASLNMPTGDNPRHALLMVGYDYCIYTLDPTVPLNGGLLRPATCIAPRGSVLNAVAPAAVGMRSLTCNRLQSAVIAAFYAAAPDRLPVASAGGGGILNVKTFDNRSGRMLMASIDPVTGGAGASALGDGTDGSGANNAYLKNTPVEINEVEVPIKFLRYGLAPDSGGAGMHRGGQATVLEAKVFSPDTIVTARNRDRTIFTAWGSKGGSPGKTTSFTKRARDGVTVDLMNNDVVALEPGDVFTLASGGGGGWGDPMTRDPERVAYDVACGKVSVEAALTLYGVVLAGDKVNVQATKIARGAAKRNSSTPTYTHNANRIDFESVWTDANYAELWRLLERAPVHSRHFVKRSIFALVAGMKPETLRGDGSEILAAASCLARTQPQLARDLGMLAAAE